MGRSSSTKVSLTRRRGLTSSSVMRQALPL